MSGIEWIRKWRDKKMNAVVEKGIEKVKRSHKEKLLMSFMAGAIIAFAYIPMIKLTDMFGGKVGLLLGSFLFPIGLFLILYMGGELVTGNMTVVGIAYLKGKVSIKDMILNWIEIFFGNILGALFAMLILGLGSNLLQDYIPIMETMALGKLAVTPLQAVLSGIGCNWFVGLAVLFYYKYKQGIIQFAGIYLPVAIFVLIGFQHCVANVALFIIPLFMKVILFKSVMMNVIWVTLGNILGGLIFVGYFNTTTSQV